MRFLRLALLLAPLWLVPLTFVGVLRSGDRPAPLIRGSIPREAHDSKHCNWDCHNRGCTHVPRLPTFLTGDSGMFGWTVRALFVAGDRAMPSHPLAGYGAVNLAVFCVLWPGVMFALYVIAVQQRSRILEARRGRRS